MRHLVSLWLCCLAFGCGPWLASAARAQESGDGTPPARPVRNVLVVAFDGPTSGESKRSRQMVPLTQAVLSDLPGVRLVSRDGFAEQVKEIRLGSQGLLDPATAKNLGKLTGADELVSGAIVQLTEPAVNRTMFQPRVEIKVAFSLTDVQTGQRKTFLVSHSGKVSGESPGEVGGYPGLQSNATRVTAAGVDAAVGDAMTAAAKKFGEQYSAAYKAGLRGTVRFVDGLRGRVDLGRAQGLRDNSTLVFFAEVDEGGFKAEELLFRGRIVKESLAEDNCRVEIAEIRVRKGDSEKWNKVDRKKGLPDALKARWVVGLSVRLEVTK